MWESTANPSVQPGQLCLGAPTQQPERKFCCPEIICSITLQGRSCELTWAWAGTATQHKTGHRAAHSLPRVVLSCPSLKIRDLFPDGAGLFPQNVWEWPGLYSPGSLGRKKGTRDRKGGGFRVVVMDRGWELWPGCPGPATRLSQWPLKLCPSHGKGRRTALKYMAVPLIPLYNSQIFLDLSKSLGQQVDYWDILNMLQKSSPSLQPPVQKASKPAVDTSLIFPSGRQENSHAGSQSVLSGSLIVIP